MISFITTTLNLFSVIVFYHISINEIVLNVLNQFWFTFSIIFDKERQIMIKGGLYKRMYSELVMIIKSRIPSYSILRNLLWYQITIFERILHSKELVKHILLLNSLLVRTVKYKSFSFWQDFQRLAVGHFAINLQDICLCKRFSCYIW